MVVESRTRKGDFELIRKIESMTDKFPPILNAFLKLDITNHIQAIGYNSHQGYVRDYNEDRIAVVFSDKLQSNNMICKFYNEPPTSFGLYSIFDGHNGFECSEYLKANLHSILLEQAFLTHKDFESRIRKIYENIEVNYKLYSIRNKRSFAGSCAITVMQYNNKLLVINLGDSRAILSSQNGQKVTSLSNDHKPEIQTEFKRIIEAGGFVYRSLWSWVIKRGYDELASKFEELERYEISSRQKSFLEVGPWRANTGGLSVTRTFGDFEAKFPELGGIPGVIICQPEIHEIELDNADFLMIGCKFNR